MNIVSKMCEFDKYSRKKVLHITEIFSTIFLSAIIAKKMIIVTIKIKFENNMQHSDMPYFISNINNNFVSNMCK